MKTRLLLLLSIISVWVLMSACEKSASAGDRPIKSAKAGEMTVSVASSTGEVKSGDNDLILMFTDESGAPVDVGAASLSFHMAGMGAMAEMNDRAALTTTEVPGKYRAQIRIEMGGTWEARIAYEGPHGTGQTTMTVNVK
jgi:hypothetical protein